MKVVASRATEGRTHRRRRLVVTVCVLLVYCYSAFASDPSLDLSQYGHTAWKVRDGVIKTKVLAISQTPDGYLWLGTDSGLFRFDGVAAIPWQPPAGAHLPGKYIPALMVTRDGTLWIGTHTGVASWKDGRLTNYPELAGQNTDVLLQDSQGTVWLGVDAPARICKIQNGKPLCEGAGELGVSDGSMYEDRHRNLWVLTQNGLWRWSPGPPERYPVSAARYSYMTEDDHGTLVLGTSDGLQQLRNGKLESYDFPGVAGRFRARIFHRTSDGSLWVGTQEGLIHQHRGRTDRFTLTDGLSGDYVNEIFEDHEGNVWVGTANGLDRFRDVTVPTVSLGQGLSTPLVFSVESTADGSIWGGTTDGLNRWQNGHMTVYGRRSAPVQNARGEQSELRVGDPATNVTNSGLSGTILSLGKDDSGRLWVASRDGVFYVEGDKFVRVPGLRGGIYAIEGDGHGSVWLLDSERGLLFWKPDGTVQETEWSRLGKNHFGFSMLPDRANDGLWLGLVEGGVVYLKDNQVRASYTVADGLGSGRVSALRLAPDGALWAATEGGLSRIKVGHIATLTSASGLPCDSVHWSMEDDDHTLWLYTPCGLVRVARDEVAAWISDSRHRVLSTTFDAANGVRSIGSVGGYGPHVTKSVDGKLWFVPGDGISVLDPHQVLSNRLPPPVHVEQVTGDGRSYSASSALRLPPRLHDLTIDYSALSLSVPEKIHFRFKLEGQDKGWREVVNARQVQYSNLAPGNYRFRVVASNNSGVWNEQGAALDFSIAPAYWQTNWFRAACVATFLLLLWALYRLRLRQIRQAFNARLEERVGERTRIARDLHDTLLQSFQGLLLRFQTAYALFDTRPADAKLILTSSIDQTAQAITEGREAVQGLRASTLERNDLARAITTLAEEIAAEASSHASVELRVGVEGTPRTLHPIVRDEIYRIGSEALRNAFRHAEAKQIEVELRYDERQLRLRIRDDGKGIDPQFLTAEGREGHFGLHGLRERAKLIGGKLTVWTAPGSGTEIELSVPASRAYTASPSPWRSWFTEKFSGSARKSGHEQPSQSDSDSVD